MRKRRGKREKRGRSEKKRGRGWGEQKKKIEMEMEAKLMVNWFQLLPPGFTVKATGTAVTFAAAAAVAAK